MDFEKYTDRARGFVQSAQSLALREGHQQFAPEHLIKVLLDDPEGLAAGLIDRSGGNSRQALSAVEAALAKVPKVSGSGAGQVYLSPALARVFDQHARANRHGMDRAGDLHHQAAHRDHPPVDLGRVELLDLLGQGLHAIPPSGIGLRGPFLTSCLPGSLIIASPSEGLVRQACPARTAGRVL